jgi:YHS domain-containing protein
MEVAGEYERPLRGEVRWQLYGGLAGEPALGPVAYPHRPSAMPNPIAPIGHHWLDASHITFGVVTAGVFTRRWKAEASVFNGREPDEDRWDLDLDALDSVSGRISFAPTADLAVQVSAGHLNEAEAGEGTLPRVDVNRVTASVTYHRRVANQDSWASTVAWGRNEEAGQATHAFLAETSVTLAERDVWFGRFELAGKEAHDLHADEFGDEVFTVGKLQAGYTRYLTSAAGLRLGVGGHLSAGFVPEALEPRYGSRANLGVGFFITVRPAAMMHGAQGAAAPTDHSGHVVPAPARSAPEPGGAAREAAPRGPSPAAEPRLPVLEAERVIDPACAEKIDLVNAPRATYQGKVYYFCTAADRDAFVKDPVAYLQKRGRP